VSEKKQDQVLDHEYDGIREYDNRLPNWWLTILYATIAFGFLYWIYHQTLGAAPTPTEHYEAELARAAEIQLARHGGGEVTNESLLLMAQVPDRLAQGRQIFDQFCVVCHSSQGEGNVGPNLTDGYWLHGGSPLEILHTIENGVPGRGMVAWGNQLGPARVQAVTAFVLSIKNTNVPGKEPQGEPERTASPEETGEGEGAGTGADTTAAEAEAAPPEGR